MSKTTSKKATVSEDQISTSGFNESVYLTKSMVGDTTPSAIKRKPFKKSETLNVNLKPHNHTEFLAKAIAKSPKFVEEYNRKIDNKLPVLRTISGEISEKSQRRNKRVVRAKLTKIYSEFIELTGLVEGIRDVEIQRRLESADTELAELVVAMRKWWANG